MIVDLATGDAEEPSPRQKNEAAAMLGRLGGKASGIARMEKIPAKKRSQIAKNAAAARWKKKS